MTFHYTEWMREFEFIDHAGDAFRVSAMPTDGSCRSEVRIDARSVHLPIPQQRALAQWLIDHLVEVRPGEDVSLVLPDPQAAVELSAERPAGYMLTFTDGVAELSVSDGISLPSMEMQMLIDAAGRAMVRLAGAGDDDSDEAESVLAAYLMRLSRALGL